jgi:hypothetical protein
MSEKIDHLEKFIEWLSRRLVNGRESDNAKALSKLRDELEKELAMLKNH